MATEKVGDLNIYYEVRGEGEPLLMISGYGDSSEVWFCQITGLCREYRVVLFDNRGAGRSDKPDIPYTMQIFAQDTAGLLEALAIDAAHIYGVSMGGMIAQEFTLRYQEKVISLILGCTMCGGPYAVMPDVEAITLLFDPERGKRLTLEEMARESLPFMFSQEFIDNNPDIVEHYIAKQVEYFPPLHGFRRQAEAIVGHDACDQLPQIKAPTLVIAGTADRLVPVENARILASTIPNAELVLLENAGHGYFVEAAVEANRAIFDFVGRHRRSR